jgi:hypothetical protein
LVKIGATLGGILPLFGGFRCNSTISRERYEVET